MSNDSLTEVGVDMKEYIEQEEVEKRNWKRKDEERGVRKHCGKYKGSGREGRNKLCGNGEIENPNFETKTVNPSVGTKDNP